MGDQQQEKHHHRYWYMGLASYQRCILAPVLLVYYAVAIYLLPCLVIYTLRAMECLWRPLGKCLDVLFCGLLCPYQFQDRSFPANEDSLGSGDMARTHHVQWVRPSKLIEGNASKKGPTLFGDGVSPSDVKQGQVGDCWLVSSLAAVAEHPGAIEKLFLTREVNPRGKYVIQIFCVRTLRWVKVVVDDRIPAAHGSSSLFAAPSGNKIWVCLLEKAIAKYAGSYAKLNSNTVAVALKMLTGDEVFGLSRTEAEWRKNQYDFTPTVDVQAQPFGKMVISCKTETFNFSQSFNLLRTYDQRKAVMGASIAADGTRLPLHGLVLAHAYTVLSVVELNGERLVQLRNPWGRQGEWTGDWSDQSNKWLTSPVIRAALRPQFVDDGAFYMSYEDFMNRFTHIHVADRSVDMSDLRLDAHENHRCWPLGGRCLGPCIGCMQGCLWYWLCCAGLGRLLGSHESSSETVPPHRASCVESSACCLCMSRTCGCDGGQRRIAAAV